MKCVVEIDFFLLHPTDYLVSEVLNVHRKYVALYKTRQHSWIGRSRWMDRYSDEVAAAMCFQLYYHHCKSLILIMRSSPPPPPAWNGMDVDIVIIPLQQLWRQQYWLLAVRGSVFASVSRGSSVKKGVHAVWF